MLATNPAPAPKNQMQKMSPSAVTCPAVLGETMPFNSGSPKNTLYIPKRRPDTVNSRRNNAEQHNSTTLK